MTRARSLCRLLPLLVLVAPGCGERVERTQVMVLIDAAPGLRTRIQGVEVMIASGPGGTDDDDLDERFSGTLARGSRVDWPLELAILPRGGDATREYLVTATALDTAGRRLVTLRARSGFVPGRTLNLSLVFDAACVTDPPECDAEHSCFEGRCAAARVEPTALPDYAVDAQGVPIVRPRAPGPFATPMDAGSGETDAAIDAGADAAPEAGPPADPDACEVDSDDCDPDPDACVNEADGYRCECPSTYMGDGIGPDGCRPRPIAIGTGDFHTCVLLATGAVKCWGRNVHGELGLGHTRRIGDSPDEMGDALAAVDLRQGHKVVELAAGGLHNCVRFEEGEIACWGENNNGGLGLGLTNGDHRGDGKGEMGDALPFVDLGGDFSIVALAANWTHTCALSDEGAVKCWGTNDAGLLGLGDTEPRGDSPADMGDGLRVVELGSLQVEELVVGDYHNCARLEGGVVKCWGANMFSGDTEPRGDEDEDMGDHLPFVELGSKLTVVQLSSGGYHMCARLSNARIKCWGDNTHGQLGMSHTEERGQVQSDMGDNLGAIDLGTRATVVQLVSGREHNCARFADGRIKCWGGNARGQLGLGDTDDRGDEPGEMGDALPFVDLGPDGEVASLASQENHTCALLQDGRVKCWGANDEAQLGLGDTDDRGDEPGEMGEVLPAVDLGSL